MYKIIGADGKEYGPISADQLRQWIAEGRANAQTRVLPEGAAEWRTVGEISEFAGATFAAPPSTSSPISPIGISSSDAAEQVNGPAIGLIVVAILGFVAQLASLVIRMGFPAMTARQQGQPEWVNMFSGSAAIAAAVIGVVTSVLILFGGLKMKKLEGYGLVMAASIVAMIPCISPCCFIGLPIGIWALMVLNKPEVKSAFH